jgi:protoporphyrin/coproporphyrin ferrochelatase
MTNNKGLLIINLGTPDSTKVSDVRKYLREFLSDPRVIDINYIARQMLLNFIILPFRPKKAAKAYQQIWTDQGSPLLVNSQNLLKKLQIKLKTEYQQIELGMCYGQPSIKSSLNNLASCDSITILPLYPQYASSSTGSALEKALGTIKSWNNIPNIKIITDFFYHPRFISSWVETLQEHYKKQPWDYLLFSYHGLPLRHIKKSESGRINCSQESPCPSLNKDNRFCYRAQCYKTTRLIAQQYGLEEKNYSVSFQSRLGVSKWIQPYTDEVLPQLYKQGVRNLAITCPAFVSDCLETLEEIAIRAKEDWLKLGGTNLTLVESLNDKDFWIDSLCEIITL